MRHPASDHFDGIRFHNPGSPIRDKKTLLEVLKWQWTSKRQAWPEKMLTDTVEADFKTPLEADKPRITFVNHATFLVQWAGLNILTDPVFSKHLGPSSLLKLKRYRPAGVSLAALPRIDLIFVSHNHYDHLDLPSLAALEARFHPRYIVPLGLASYLPQALRSRTHELDWWDSLRDEKHAFETILTPAQHWSKRTPWDTNRSLWAGCLFRHAGKSVFFAGDSAYAAHFKEVQARLGGPTVALLPIGAYEPRWFMKASHMNPAEALQAHLDLAAQTSIGMHFGTFRLTDEGIDEPVKDLLKAREELSLSEESFRVPKNGQSFQF